MTLTKEEIQILEEVAQVYNNYIEGQMNEVRQMYRWGQVYDVFGDSGQKWEESKPIYELRTKIIDHMHEHQDKVRKLMIKIYRK